MSWLLEKGVKLRASVEKTGLGQCTALHLAVEANNYDGVKKLIELSKCDKRLLEAKTGAKGFDKDETALHLAARKGIPDIIKLLLDQGSEPGARSRASKTPLHRAIQSGNKTAVAAIINHEMHPPALIFEPDSKGNTALHLAAEVGSIEMVAEICEAAKEQSAKLPRDIRELESFADIPNHNQGGKTPLDLARARDRADVVSYLKQIGRS